MNSFDVYFLGKLMEGYERDQVKEKIGKKFKVFGHKLDHMFSGAAVRIKADLDVTLAGKYREIFRSLGALVEIVPAGESVTLLERAADKEAQPASADEPASFELLPAHTGSLIDIAPPATPDLTPDTDQFGLSPAGALLPEAMPDAPFEVDISYMEKVPLESGAVEYFSEQEQEFTVPDISHLQATKPTGENLVDELEEAEAQPLPDISHLDVTPANTGSLEDCKEDKQATEIPDISKISIKYD